MAGTKIFSKIFVPAQRDTSLSPPLTSAEIYRRPWGSLKFVGIWNINIYVT